MYRLAVALLSLFFALPAAADTVDPRLAPCLACHGESGQSLKNEVPSLGGQPEFYLTVQLVLFRESIRVVEPMNAMLKGLSDNLLRRMAESLARLPAPKPSGEPADPGRVERARYLVAAHRCNFCHNEDFSGEKNAPRLAGQREDYLIKALRDYKSNARPAYDPSMADVMYPLSDADILDLAHFLARVR